MIRSLNIKGFKAFNEDFQLELEGKSQLIYGANGAGKSSLYESFRVFLFKEKLESSIRVASTQEEQIQFNDEFWDEYRNRLYPNDFEILVNQSSSEDFNRDEYTVFLMSGDNISDAEYISFEDIISSLFFDHDDTVQVLCTQLFKIVQDNVNDLLHSIFRENFTIEIDPQNDYKIRFNFTGKGIAIINGYKKYINEARINLVHILLSLSIAELNYKNKNKDSLLVFDDILTSFDVANRAFILKYVFSNFKDSQIIFFTHNIHLFNLSMYLINDIAKEKENWEYKSIYDSSKGHRIVNSTIETAEDIRTQFELNDSNLLEFGNKIRQRFEVILYQLSHLLLIGAVEESKHILSRIESRKCLYIKNGKVADDLVDEIERELKNRNTRFLKKRIKGKINKYKTKDYDLMIGVLKDLKIFRKITLHPMSHGILGRSVYTVKEIDISLSLLERLEKYSNRLSGSHVDGM